MLTILFILTVSPFSFLNADEKESERIATQAERRNQKRLQVGGLFFQQIAITRINYNLSSNVSFFFSGIALRGGNVRGVEFEENTDKIVGVKAQWTSKSNFVTLGLDWFPIDFIPIYLTGFIGSQQPYRVTVEEFISVNPLDSRSVFQESPFGYTATPRRATMVGLGIGFRWVFSNGIYVGLHFARYYAEQKVDFYVYTEPRLEATANVEQVWAYQKYLEQRFGTFEYFQMFYPYVGFSF